MLNPIQASDKIKEEYISYVSTRFHISDPGYRKQFLHALREEGMAAKGPYLEISDNFQAGKSLEALIEEGIVSPLYRSLEPGLSDGKKEIQIERPLYAHQEMALRAACAGRNMVITTGTGSGKTECFVIPIINELLREVEKGTLGDGVRAILIYPMNALANDQMKRLRATLKNYPQISFGVYNSSTEYTEEKGIRKYTSMHKGERPIPNERISRDMMQSHPPNILVTNYAMLEYMMLRPHDDAVFSGASLRFLVLDEAHIYRGATGIETSLLLRRLKARVSNPDRVLHILTSATLGGPEENPAIVNFAGTLCHADFREENIIRSSLVRPVFEGEPISYPAELFAELSRAKEPMNVILDRYHVDYDASRPDAEILYDLCLSSSLYRDLRKAAVRPMTVREISEAMSGSRTVSEQDIVHLIDIVSRSEKNRTALLKARYHMFVRALEGAYISINEDSRLFLQPRENVMVGEDSFRVFEAVACDECGRIGIQGVPDNNMLVSTSGTDQARLKMYVLKKQGEEIFAEEEDGDTGEISVNDYVVCAVCGEIHHQSHSTSFICGHPAVFRIKVHSAEDKSSSEDPSGRDRTFLCPCCRSGSLRTLQLGHDMATAVVGTELFEQLPEQEYVLESSKAPAAGKGFFGRRKMQARSEVVRKSRQFLAFSDSRSEAAFFANYMESSYKEFLRRRGLWHVIRENRASMDRRPWSIKDLVMNLTAYFDESRSFAEPDDAPNENLTSRSEMQAWIAVLNEMVNSRRSTSLVSLGICRFTYKGINDDVIRFVTEEYGLDEAEARDLLNLLVMDIVNAGAIECGVKLLDVDREYIYYSVAPKRVKKKRDAEEDKGRGNLLAWSPNTRSGGTFYRSGRMTRVKEALQVDEQEAENFLNAMWDEILCGGEYCLSSDSFGSYFDAGCFEVEAGTERVPVYRCGTCGTTSMFNVRGRCQQIRCGGQLRQIPHEELIEGNHYASLYASDSMKPLHIREHTAQLGRDEQQRYQDMFVQKKLNALSCSTTFEMGVDVGDLETVFLRNMPPSPANYVQRAGRAGRSLHSAAYALTYAKKGSHDYTYYSDPVRMISGRIGVPVFSIQNEKIVRRHIYAVALSAFFAANEDVYDSNNADVFLNRDGFERFRDYLDQKPEGLRSLLEKSIPAEMQRGMGISSFAWAESLVGKEGILTLAVNEFRQTVEWYKEQRDKAQAQKNYDGAARFDRELKKFRKAPEDGKERNQLIEFLVRSNVLPKYGFPVDTVELYQNYGARQGKELQMVRDLQMAVSEYAPGSQVVADGRLYTSRYIRKMPGGKGGDWETYYIAECGNPDCKTWNYRNTEAVDEGYPCISCGKMIPKNSWKSSIEPRMGFFAETPSKDVPMRRPRKAYHSQDYYLGDTQRQEIRTQTLSVNDGALIRMESSRNDSLMVVCTDKFYVCKRCGYTESTRSLQNQKGFSEIFPRFTAPKAHKAPWGTNCGRILEANRLCHIFKTDVVRLMFVTPEASDYDRMLSVMYALLEAASSVLQIERNDIKGCLFKVPSPVSSGMLYSIILYDAVAGGAGQIRRIYTEDGAVLQKVIEEAIRLTETCTCDPSCYKCLRNYYNQQEHNHLKRREVFGFLKQFHGPCGGLNTDEEPAGQDEDSLSMDQITAGNCIDKDNYESWAELIDLGLIPESAEEICSSFEGRIPVPDKADLELTIRVKSRRRNAHALFFWEKERVMIFESEEECLKVTGWLCLPSTEMDTARFRDVFR